jgi:hypothetical protein
MGKKVKERVISEAEYLARLEQGVPVGNCWVDMGNGQLAYALQEVVVVGVPFNKYGDKFFDIHTLYFCVTDNIYIDTQKLDAQADIVKQHIAFEQRKKDMKNRLYKITKEYFSLKKAQSFPNQQLLNDLQCSEIFLLLGITHDDRLLSIDAFPLDLYAKETPLINEFVQIRSVTAKPIKPSDPGTIKRAPTGYEKWDMERRQLDPFAYRVAQQPIIKAVAVGGLVMMGATGAGALYKAGAFSIETNLKAVAIKGGASAIGQAIAGDGAKDINVTGVASDAFLCPGVGSVVGNAVEWKPFDKTQPFSMVGYNKSFGEFGIESATSYGFDKIGGYGFNKFSVYMGTQGEKIFYDIFNSTWLQVINNATIERLTQGYESPDNQDN